MEFDNAFDVPLPPDQTWAVLMDIPRIAPCMPGAELTEVVDARNYKGKISVRLGPVALAFAGRVEIDAIDEPIAAPRSRRRAATPRAAVPPTPPRAFVSSRPAPAQKS